ncbi:hypothetical protein L3X38_031987 [Prunus dulcis]|uniref:Uncharacterized protein n=1 Tax=Prunus dulcis TaxID=3755 RepID=A0AAD4YVH1_PRUDU|nr:hypothetical protein L3X38_031987 [Prunus dulcis]
MGFTPLPEVNAASWEVNATSYRGSVYKRGCGAMGHWVRTSRTPKNLADLYQASIKNKKVETNYIDHAIPNPQAIDGSSEISRQYLDVSDFVTERGNEAYGSELD